MNLIDRINAMAAAGRHDEVYALVVEKSGTGDPEASFVLGSWRLWGEYGPRDLAEAHRLLDYASREGHEEARLLRAALLANGTGTEADWTAALGLLETMRGNAAAAAQLDILAAMDIDAQGRPLNLPALSPLSERPWVRKAAGLLTARECAYLIEAASPRLEPSSVIDRQGRRVPNPVRTSEGTSFGPAHEDPVVRAVNLRLAALSETDVRCGEPLHMLCYRAGQQYRPHLDYIPGQHNQRVLTVLLYLNEQYEGGETEFTQTGLKVRPGQGDAIVFRNATSSGEPDPASRHAGLPVGGGTKWLATRWIRERPYHPWDGQGQ